MVVKPSAYDSAGKPPRQAKKNLLGGLAGRLKRNGIRKESSIRGEEASFDGSLSYSGAVPSSTVVSGPPFDERTGQPTSARGPEKPTSEGFAVDRQDESESRVATASAPRRDTPAAVPRTTSARSAPGKTPGKGVVKNAKPKQTLVITSKKALYDPEVRAEVTRLYNLIHRVNNGPSAKPMYASTSVARSNHRYSTRPKKLRSSFLTSESFDEDSFGKRPPRKLRVIKCPLADKGGNPFDKEDLSSIGSVLGSSKVTPRKTSASHLSSSVLRCLGVDSDPSNANHKSLARQPEEDSGVRVSSEEGPVVDATPEASPTFCGLFNLGSTGAKEAVSPHQESATTPVAGTAAIVVPKSKSTSVEPKKPATFLPCFWSFFEEEPKETRPTSTTQDDVEDVCEAPSQATSLRDQSVEDFEGREESFHTGASRDAMSGTGFNVEEREETHLDVIAEKLDGTSECRGVADSPPSDPVSTPEPKSETCSSNQRLCTAEPRTPSGTLEDRLPQPTSSTNPRGPFPWFRRSKKPAAGKLVKRSTSSVIYLNAPREVENEDRSEVDQYDQHGTHCPPAEELSTVGRKSDDALTSSPSCSNERSNVEMESKTNDESGEIVRESLSRASLVLQENPRETPSANERSNQRHSFKRTPSLISVKSLRTLVSTTSEVLRRQESLGHEETMSVVRATASNDASRVAERPIRQGEETDSHPSAPSTREKRTPEGEESNQSYLLGYLLAQIAFQREGDRSGNDGSKPVNDRAVLNPEKGMTLPEIMHLLQKHHTPRLSKDYLTYILAEFARHACTVDRAALQKGYVERLSKRPAALQAAGGDANFAPNSHAEEKAAISAPAVGAVEEPEETVTSFSQESSSYRASRGAAASGSCTSDVASVTNSELGRSDGVDPVNHPSSVRWSCFRLGSCFGPVSHANSMTNEDLDDFAEAVETTIDALRGDAAEDSSVGSSGGQSQNEASEHDIGAWFDFLDGKEESYYSSGEFVDDEIDAEAVSVASDDVMHPSSTLSQCY